MPEERPEENGTADDERSAGPTDADIVEAAAAAAEGVILERYRQSELRDLDVTVQFTDGVLDVDVYLNPPADADEDPEAVVEAAVEAAEAAVDDLFADTEAESDTER